MKFRLRRRAFLVKPLTASLCAIALTGCDNPKPDVAIGQCATEAMRVFVNHPATSAADPETYIAFCMQAHGYSMRMSTDCHKSPDPYRDPICYRYAP